MARVVENAGALVAANGIEEALEGHAIMQVFARMQFIADVHAGLVKRVEDGHPAPAKFREGLVDQARGALWPGIKKRPGQSA